LDGVSANGWSIVIIMVAWLRGGLFLLLFVPALVLAFIRLGFLDVLVP